MVRLEKNTPFAIRGFNLCESILRHTPEQLQTFIRRMKHLNMNTLIVHYDYGWQRYKDLILKECKAANINISLMTFGPRTFFSYVDWKKEYFARDTNGKVFTERPECETHPCRFVPESLDAFEKGAELWLKSLPPEITRVHMRAGDGMMFCQCEKCSKLTEYDRWQPFVERFVRAVENCRPELEYETDIYYKRYRIPSEPAALGGMKYIMYDTFFRKPSCPLGQADLVTDGLRQFADSTHCNSSTRDISAFHTARLNEWTSAFPGKMYIHENAMLQGYMGVFQYGTSAYLRDLEMFRALGIQGVCYEAYEPGYQNYQEMFEVLARALNGEEVCWKEQPLEELLPQSQIYRFCSDINFPAEKYISDPVVLQHLKLYARFWQNPDHELFKDYVEFALNHDGRLDPILIAWYCAQAGVAQKKLCFKNISPEALDFTARRKLWDFMEDIPLSENPLTCCRNIINELLSGCSAV